MKAPSRRRVICYPFPPCHLFKAVRVNVTRANEGIPHSHDFAEVFWVCRGTGTHLVNGRRQALRAGDLCMIRPAQDTHVIMCGSADFTVVNVAFSRAIFASIRRRYYGSAAFWGGGGPGPELYHLTAGEQQWLNTAADGLIAAPHTRLALDRFLLNLLTPIGPSIADPYRACPQWLRSACDQMQQPGRLESGVSAFFGLAGRSPEHVARTLKRHTGKTPTDIVNEARMAHASGQLQTTPRKIVDISMECGFKSLSHFYALFRRAYGMSPLRYRRSQFKPPVHPPYYPAPP
jgi:AraC family transcriptional regulator, dual regulator of chb operon